MSHLDTTSVRSSAPHEPVFVDAARAPLPRKASRSFLLDAARAVAGALIVWCHVNTTFYTGEDASYSWIAGTFGVPFYLFVALMFCVVSFARDPGQSTGAYLVGRVKKLYLPFLVWSGVYLALTFLKTRSFSELGLSWTMLFSGSREHLYFLPLLLICTTVLALIAKRVIKSEQLSLTLGIPMAAAGLFIAFLDLPRGLHTAHPADGSRGSDFAIAMMNYYRALPAALWAMAFALYFGRSGRRLQTAGIVGVMGGVVTVVCIVGQIIGKPNMLARSLSGIGWMLLACAPWNWSWLKPLAIVGRHSFGIYLAHIAFIRVAVMVIERRGIELSLPLELLVFAFAFVGSFVLSVVLSKSPLTDWMVGYDAVKVRSTLGKPPVMREVSVPQAMRDA
jgi:surface polysaccharide O-acyltransferase-like enzyme